MGVRFAERLWRTGCLARRIRQAAGLSYGGPWRREGTGRDPVLATSLRIERRTGSEPITLLEAQGSVLFDLRPAGRSTLPAEEQTGRLPLRITPGRCDQHARSQASQRSLLRFLDEACGSRR